MATTATPIVPRKPKRALSKAHRAKLVSALAKWRASLTEEERAELSARTAATHRARWDNLTERERKAWLAGVKAWQAQQRAAKRAAAKATPKAPVMASGTKAPAKGSRADSVGETPSRAGRTRKAAAN